MICDVAGCEAVVSHDAASLHPLIAALDDARAGAWRDLYGEVSTPCARHILDGLSITNAIASGAGALEGDTSAVGHSQ